jgi:type IV pilus assembly protein PilP
MMQMRKITKYALCLFIAIGLTGVVACGEKAPPQRPAPAVQKKITDQQPAPVEKAAQPGTKKDEGAASVDTQAESASEDASALVEASLKIASSYDPQGRFDPFEPLFKEQPTAPEVAPRKGRREKRVPQTPLERVALSQLKLSAIMRTSKGNKAIVEDATGKGYVIKKGTYVGLNSGQVILIDKARVVVEEEIENVLGELVIQSTELKLQKPAGEL